MLLLLIFSSLSFAFFTMITLFSENATSFTFCLAVLMLFFSILSGFKFAEAYTEVEIAKNILKHPSLYGEYEVNIINGNVRHMKEHKLYYFGLGIKKLKEVNIFNIDGVDFMEVKDEN